VIQINKAPPDLLGYDYSKNDINTAVSKKKLLILLLAYNARCNLKCLFCFTNQGTRSSMELEKQQKTPELLNLKELKWMIDQSVDLGAKSVCLYGEGEPLLNKNLFFKLVSHINHHGLIPIVFTNGTLVDRKTAKKLFNNNVSVVGKLYSLDPEINEYLTGNKNIYEYVNFGSAQVPSHIKHLVDVGYANSNRFALHTVITVKNYLEIPKIWFWEREQGIIPRVDFLYLPNEKLDITEEQRKDLHRKIWSLDKELGYEYPLFFGPHLGHRFCDTRASLFIDANGMARICAATYIFVGDARKESLKEIVIKKLEIESTIGRCYDRNCVYCDCYKYNKEKLPSQS